MEEREGKKVGVEENERKREQREEELSKIEDRRRLKIINGDKGRTESMSEIEKWIKRKREDE